MRLREAEASRIAAFLGLDEREFADRFTRITADRQALTLTEHEDGSCVFYDGTGCRIHEVKPRQCRDFPGVWNFPGFGEVCRARPVE